jgi:cell wall-associated NlpC family hydrolase
MPMLPTVSHLIMTSILTGVLSWASLCQAADAPLLSLFPLAKYDQTISRWIDPQDKNYEKSLLTEETQQKHFALFNEYFWGTSSPWNGDYVNRIIRQASPSLKSIEQDILNGFDNRNTTHKTGYGANFRAYEPAWIERIINNINLNQFDGFHYQADHRAITIENLHARALPSEEVFFYSHTLAGEGYPFDNLQMSALWAGTPLYVLAETRDHAWSYVITPHFLAWIKTSGIAYTTPHFIKTWAESAQKQLVAITQTETSLVDEQGQFLQTAYVGTVLPGEKTRSGIKVAVPVTNQHHHAVIKYAMVSYEQAALMPLAATRKNFATLMKTLLGRPYGWGGMYFYSDCSQELKDLFTPFGIYLPRHSSDQVSVGKKVDLTTLPKEQRLAYLMEKGHPFLSLVHIPGHVFLHLGNYPNPNSEEHEWVALSYQDIWGLRPPAGDRRAVIGQAVLFPILLQYPEDPTLVSLAEKQAFEVSFIDELEATPLLRSQMPLNLRALMIPNENKEI